MELEEVFPLLFQHFNTLFVVSPVCVCVCVVCVWCVWCVWCVCVVCVCGVCVVSVLCTKYRVLISYNMRYFLRNFIRFDFELILSVLKKDKDENGLQ
jgi:hypothetical protein